ncbi:filamentous hemagglutinin N-terminal domain-containing protein [Acidovorax cavernicola]|uniref:Filamentous hemagglutinin N-terminal domain-containing protein n=1 Tax=Acidovorax cavernicola TaxID=1675792 RepID=A0A9X8CZP1_9BURK|nr:filamentous hemagglutinin N-terminal domain-containing protein [Acidovorax cavernicola]RIX73419.1 filamentous hemagglutinin N-terminal domain-containing protein [Acidovorax cavernicola]
MKPRNLSPRHPLRPLALSIACMGLAPALAQSILPSYLPGQYITQGGVSVANKLGVSPMGGQSLAISQSSLRAIIDWQSFSIGKNDAVNISHTNPLQGAASILLNRVTGNDLSTIAGQLTSPGRVFLVNPNGVVFGQNAQVNVGGLVASTLALSTSDNDFLGGATQLAFARDDANAKVVSNAGVLTATGGPVVLMGAEVTNTGRIVADGSTVALASGRKISFDLGNDGLTNLVVAADGMATSAKVVNAAGATLQADGGRVMLIGNSTTAGQLVVNQSGTVRARTLENVNGEIVLGAGANNRIEMNGGTLDATGAAAGQHGGAIRIAAGQVRIEGTGGGDQRAVIDASGQAGGGDVTIHGYDVALSSTSVVRADATTGGAGGTITTASAQGKALVGDADPGPERASNLQAFGEFTARGAGDGKGGTISNEADAVRIQAVGVDAGGGANGGANGRWNVTAKGSHLSVVNAGDVPAYDSALPFIDTSTVSAGSVGATLGRGTDVTLATTPTGIGAGVTFAAGAKVVKSEGGTARLRVDSSGSIVMNSGSAIESQQGALHVDFNADATGRIATNAKNINNSSGNPSAESDYAGAIVLDGATISANGGDVRFFGQGDAQNGRAIGGLLPIAGNTGDYVFRDGITLSGSTVTTQGSGQVVMRGQGRTWIDDQDNSDFIFRGSNGVTIMGGAVAAGSGGLQLDGLAGYGSSGVALSSGAMLRSVGDIGIKGQGPTWTSDIGAAAVGASTAVVIDDATVAGERNVRIEGQGANLDGMRTDTAFAGGNMSAGGGNGVAIRGAVSAGAGQRIDVIGHAGSEGFSATLGSPDIIITPSTTPTYGVAVTVDADRPMALRTDGGTIAIDGQGTDVSMRLTTFISSVGSSVGTVASVASDSGKGGSISVRGRNVLIDGATNFDGSPAVARLDASGTTGGGSIDIAGSNAVAIGKNTSLEANATGTGSGNGGSIQVVATETLRAYGQLSARAGAAGGDGGRIETSAGRFDLRGARVDASAPMGAAGQWFIDPFDLTISHGNTGGTLPSNPYDALANSTIEDGDINTALNGGTSVRISTGTGTGGSGVITLEPDVDINYTGSKGPLTLQLDAASRIQTRTPGTTIRATGGDDLNVVFNAGVNPDGTPSGSSGAIDFAGKILTQGGSVTMNAVGTGTPGSGFIRLDGGQVITDGGNVSLLSGQPGAPTGTVILTQDVQVDTRVGQSDAGAGGNVRIEGGDVLLQGARIATATGNVDILGTSTTWDSGVVITSGQLGPSTISTTSGNVTVQGVARRQASSTFAAAHGVLINGGSSITTGSGNIAVRGYNFNNDPSAPGATEDSGVRLENGAQLVTTGGGNIEVTGRSQNGGRGVVLQAGGSPTAPGALPGIRSSGNVLLRASNDGSGDSIVIEAPVVAAGTIDLRPGGVDVNMNASDNTATPIVLGGPTVNGFSVSSAEFAQLSAPTIVAGSTTHAADITVAGALSTSGALTLQNEGGGNIALNAPVSATTLGLLSAGNVSQSGAGAITAGSLLARSRNGSVDLRNPANDVATVGGGAAGGFAYVDANAVTIGPVSVTGFDAAGNLPQVTSADSMAANTVLVRTLSGDLTLGAPVSSTSGTDLVAAARFQNPGGYGISGALWRVWADTWVGETRGGLAGSGPLPNFYHCAYLGLCTVTVTPGDNHFIYAQQPTATVVIADASRAVGAPNPFFIYSLTGLILGDTGAGFSGSMFSPALPGSPPGLYPINGSFTSAEGYAVRVVPGQLRVSGLPMLPSVDVVRDPLTSYLYDKNIGQAPICLATGPLDGDRAQQGADVLAREWSRVRSRPNLLSCVNTERRNGCSDF